MNEIAESFSDVASFLIVYIAEAHAQDEWPIGKTVCVNKHKTLEDRIAAAKKHLIEDRDCKIKTIVDGMDDLFEKRYHGWPERYYIFQGNLLRKIGMPSKEDKGWDKANVSNWLRKYKLSLNSNATSN